MKKVAALFLGFIVMHAEAVILTIDNIKAIEEELEKADRDTLVVLDCDDVLIEMRDIILKLKNRELLKSLVAEHMKELKCSFGKKASKDEAYKFFSSIVLRDAKVELLNYEWPLLILNLQSRGVKVVLLSACETDQFGVIKSMFEWRYNQLLNLGIDFKKSWRDLDEITFNGRKGFNGILLSGKLKKGDVLKIFLKKISQYKFKNIIFIDDLVENLKSVEEYAKKVNVNFTGIEYMYAKIKNDTPIDLKKAKQQIDALIRYKRWTSE